MRMLFTTLCCLALSFTVPAQTYTGKVVSVADGDTIEMLVDGKTVRVRLFGIDSPERGQPFGTKAREYTSALCFGKTVKAVKQRKDQYGRLVAEVCLPDGSSLNLKLVAAGYAWQYRQFSKNMEVAAAEQTARKQKLGLWKDAHPIAPWEWRKQKRTLNKAS